VGPPQPAALVELAQNLVAVGRGSPARLAALERAAQTVAHRERLPLRVLVVPLAGDDRVGRPLPGAYAAAEQRNVYRSELGNFQVWQQMLRETLRLAAREGSTRGRRKNDRGLAN
jgi:hypothetical protein